MTENQSELEKLKKAALLIEEMSMGRLKVCPSVAGHVYIRPEHDAYIGLEMRITPDHPLERYAVTFTACPRRMGVELDASGLRALAEEVNESYALLSALEMREYRPSQEDMAAFREFLDTRQEQAAAEQSGPVMGQTF